MYRNFILVGFLCLIIGIGVGSRFRKVVEKEVVRDKIVTQDKIVTIVKQIKAPDGTETTETVRTEDKTAIVEHKAEKLTERPVDSKWRITGGYGPQKAIVGAEVRIISAIWAGAQIDTQGNVVGTLSIEF